MIKQRQAGRVCGSLDPSESDCSPAMFLGLELWLRGARPALRRGLDISASNHGQSGQDRRLTPGRTLWQLSLLALIVLVAHLLGEPLG